MGIRSCGKHYWLAYFYMTCFGLGLFFLLDICFAIAQLINLMSNVLFRYNFSSKAVSEVESEEVDSEVEEWRSELDSSLNDYIKNFYPNGIYTVIWN